MQGVYLSAFNMHQRQRTYKNDEFRLGIASAVDIIIGRGLLVVFVLTFAIFIALAFAWIGILNSFNGSNVISTDLTIVLDSVGGIFIFIYLTVWLNDSISGYSEGPRRMREAFYQICYLTRQSAAFLKSNNVKSKDGLERIRKNGLMLLMCMYRLFIPRIAYGEMVEKIYTDLLQEMNDRKISDTVEKTTVILIEARTWSFSSAHYTSDQLVVLEKAFEKLDQFVRDLDVAINVRGANIFRGHLLFSLYIYFFIWIPIAIEPFVSNLTFVVSYPILMFILTGPMIYKIWLRDPFDPNRPIIYNDYGRWFVMHGDDICRSTE